MSLDEKLMMYHHGTLRWQPSPSVLLQAAEHALLELRESRKARNARAQAKAVGGKASHQARAKKGAFLYEHVRDAARASDVLRNAIKGIADARKAKEVDTLLVYQSQENLEIALKLTLEKEGIAEGGLNPGAGLGPTYGLGL